MNRHLLIALMTVLFATISSLQARAVDEDNDTVYFYTSWEHLFNVEPDTIIVDLTIDLYSPFELYFETNDRKTNSVIKNGYIVAALGDTTFLVNSNYLRKFFKGDSKRLHGYNPLYFNERLAFAVAEEYMYAGIGDVDFTVISTYNYLIDFKQRKVFRVDSEMLSELLEDYHDLQMRYEGMANYEKQSIINDYFLKYVDRASLDALRPYILDQVDDEGK